jgi:hypothetical protein
MSVEKRRAKIIKRRKISKIVRAVKNKQAFEFKRKDDIYKIILPIITQAGRNGVTSTDLREALIEKHSINISIERLVEILRNPIKNGEIKKKTDKLDNLLFVIGKPSKK